VRRPTNNAYLGTNAMDLLREAAEDPNNGTVLWPLLQLVCEALDLAGLGEDIYITFGKNKHKSAFCVTRGWDGNKDYVTADNVVDLATGISRWLAEA